MSMISKSTLVRRVCRSLLAAGLIVLSTQAFAEARQMFKRIPTQYIAALGEPDASAGTGAERWGLWRKDPGPRGVWLRRFDRLKTSGGVAPAKWKFDETDWWLDENGLIMEKPDFSLPPGKYLVSGDRETISVLTVHPMDNQGGMGWELGFGAKLYDVTHLPCRSARYRPSSANASCTPDSASKGDFPVNPGHSMPLISGCRKQDYAVLFVVGVAVETKTTASARTACRSSGKKYPGARMLEGANGALVVCSEPKQATATAATPYMVRRADLRSFSDKSQRPRCNAKTRIETNCGTSELCVFEVNDGLCSEPEVAKHTTHAQVEWKCSADKGWRFERVERGKELVFDCRQ
ncbi:MAG: hypothetical protein GY948_14605 [Alphaproteobacteria bacterium]|nr:hypothetical protein [Alphaproteobacteria bacterium]